MRTAINILLLSMLLCAVGASAQTRSGERGIYLCTSPLSAFQFWQDVKSAQEMGATLTAGDLERIARKQNERSGKVSCFWLAARHDLKPIYADAGGMLVLTNGKIRGWVTPQYYVFYLNSAPPK